MQYERLTNGLIRKLNKACEALREAGKCGDSYECFCIGWCEDAWSACGITPKRKEQGVEDERQ